MRAFIEEFMRRNNMRGKRSSVLKFKAKDKIARTFVFKCPTNTNI